MDLEVEGRRARALPPEFISSILCPPGDEEYSIVCPPGDEEYITKPDKKRKGSELNPEIATKFYKSTSDSDDASKISPPLPPLPPPLPSPKSSKPPDVLSHIPIPPVKSLVTAPPNKPEKVSQQKRVKSKVTSKPAVSQIPVPPVKSKKYKVSTSSIPVIQLSASPPPPLYTSPIGPLLDTSFPPPLNVQPAVPPTPSVAPPLPPEPPVPPQPHISTLLPSFPAQKVDDPAPLVENKLQLVPLDLRGQLLGQNSVNDSDEKEPESIETSTISLIPESKSENLVPSQESIAQSLALKLFALENSKPKVEEEKPKIKGKSYSIMGKSEAKKRLKAFALAKKTAAAALTESSAPVVEKPSTNTLRDENVKVDKKSIAVSSKNNVTAVPPIMVSANRIHSRSDGTRQIDLIMKKEKELKSHYEQFHKAALDAAATLEQTQLDQIQKKSRDETRKKSKSRDDDRKSKRESLPDGHIPQTWNEVRRYGLTFDKLRRINWKLSERKKRSNSENSTEQTHETRRTLNPIYIKQGSELREFPGNMIKHTTSEPSVSYSTNPFVTCGLYKNRTEILNEESDDVIEIMNDIIIKKTKILERMRRDLAKFPSLQTYAGAYSETGKSSRLWHVKNVEDSICELTYDDIVNVIPVAPTAELTEQETYGPPPPPPVLGRRPEGYSEGKLDEAPWLKNRGETESPKVVELKSGAGNIDMNSEMFATAMKSMNLKSDGKFDDGYTQEELNAGALVLASMVKDLMTKNNTKNNDSPNEPEDKGDSEVEIEEKSKRKHKGKKKKRKHSEVKVKKDKKARKRKSKRKDKKHRHSNKKHRHSNKTDMEESFEEMPSEDLNIPVIQSGSSEIPHRKTSREYNTPDTFSKNPAASRYTYEPPPSLHYEDPPEHNTYRLSTDEVIPPPPPQIQSHYERSPVQRSRSPTHERQHRARENKYSVPPPVHNNRTLVYPQRQPDVANYQRETLINVKLSSPDSNSRTYSHHVKEETSKPEASVDLWDDVFSIDEPKDKVTRHPSSSTANETGMSKYQKLLKEHSKTSHSNSANPQNDSESSHVTELFKNYLENLQSHLDISKKVFSK